MSKAGRASLAMLSNWSSLHRLRARPLVQGALSAATALKSALLYHGRYPFPQRLALSSRENHDCETLFAVSLAKGGMLCSAGAYQITAHGGQRYLRLGGLRTTLHDGIDAIDP